MYWPRISLFLTFAIVSFAGIPANAQEIPADDGDQATVAEPSADQAPFAAPAQEKKKKADVLIAPVPFTSPTSGAGLAAGVVAFYNPNDAPHQWMSGGGIVWTSQDTRGIGAFHSMSLDNDLVRIKASVSLFDSDEKFYGIGDEAGDRGEALTLDDRKLSLQVRAQLRVFEHGYVGGQYRLAVIDAKPEGTSPTPAPHTDQLDSTLSMIGPTFAYDTRDNHDQPRRGVDIDASWLFGIDALGNSFDHNKLVLTGSAYRAIGRKTVLAVNALFCSTDGNVPYYNLCLFGSKAALRGYPTGRYRDSASWAAQAEVRHRLAKRWAGAIFFGIGGIGPSAGSLLDDGNVLPAGGLGARYSPFKDNDVQLRLDIAVGKDDVGVYLGIGEAF